MRGVGVFHKFLNKKKSMSIIKCMMQNLICYNVTQITLTFAITIVCCPLTIKNCKLWLSSHFLRQHGRMQFGLFWSSRIVKIATFVLNLLYTIIRILILFTCFLNKGRYTIFEGDLLNRSIGRLMSFTGPKPNGNNLAYSSPIIASFVRHSIRSKPLASFPITIFTNIFPFFPHL